MKSKRDVDSPLKKLLNNTLLFAIGNFGSKILVLLLVPIYTASLTTAEYGTIDLILNVVNMALMSRLWAYTIGGGDVHVDRKVPKEKRTSNRSNDWWR